MEELYDHQKEIIDDDPLWCGLWLGTGSAKTRTALELAEGSILGVAPKTQKEDRNFEKNIEKFNITKPLTVLSKEVFRSKWESLPYYDTVIIDEADDFFGVHPDTHQKNGQEIPKTSQLFSALRKYIAKHNPKRYYLLTATPGSKPMSVFAIGVLLRKIPMTMEKFYAFRARFYIQRKMGYRVIWIPRADNLSKETLAKMIKSWGYTGQLSDWFEVPRQNINVISVEMNTEQKNALMEMNRTEPNPMGRNAKQRTIENGILYVDVPVLTNGKEVKFERTHVSYGSLKYKELETLLKCNDKLIVYAGHKGSIIEIEKYLSERITDLEIFVMTGDTKDRGTLLAMANNSPRCVIIIQSQISAGYELPSFRAMAFFSKSRIARDYIQSLGRNLRANNLQENNYYHLVVRGGSDEACHKSIMSGKDFHEMVME